MQTQILYWVKIILHDGNKTEGNIYIVLLKINYCNRHNMAMIGNLLKNILTLYINIHNLSFYKID